MNKFFKIKAFLFILLSVPILFVSCGNKFPGTDRQVSLHELKPLPTGYQSQNSGNNILEGEVITFDNSMSDSRDSQQDLPFGYRNTEATVMAFDTFGGVYATKTNKGRYYFNNLPDNVVSLSIVPHDTSLKSKTIREYFGGLKESAVLKGGFGARGISYLSSKSDLLLTIAGMHVSKNDDLEMNVSVVYNEENFQTLGLNEKNFSIHINGGKRFFQLSTEQSDQEIIADIVLVIDVSGSMAGSKMELAKKAASLFVDRVADKARISIISFRNIVEVLTDFSSDREHLQNTIDGLSAGDGTALWDGAKEALLLMQQNGNPDTPKYIILFTDGEDNSSQHSVQQLIEEFSGAYFPIIAGVTPDGKAQEIKTLTDVFGGMVISLADDTIHNLFVGMVTQLENPYKITIPLYGVPYGENIVGIKATVDESTSGVWCGYFDY